jgi:hypothetical protein
LPICGGRSFEKYFYLYKLIKQPEFSLPGRKELSRAISYEVIAGMLMERLDWVYNDDMII